VECCCFVVDAVDVVVSVVKVVLLVGETFLPLRWSPVFPAVQRAKST